MTIASGYGSNVPKWVLHIENRPPLETFEQESFRVLAKGEAAQVIAQTSNHWRKVFSIMAKISFGLFETGCDTWQEYRDSSLLTENGFEAISYQKYDFAQNQTLVSIICGFKFAQTQLSLDELYPLDTQPKLLVAEQAKCIVTPYFDWRQLNNEMLASLISLMRTQVSR